MKDTKKLAKLLKELKEYGYDIKEKNLQDEINLKESSAISEETIKRLNSNDAAEFEAFLAWNKAF